MFKTSGFLICLLLIAFLASCATQTAKSNQGSNNGNNGTDINIPDTPDALSLMDSSDNAVKLRWNDNSDNESGFVIQRSADASFTNISEIIVPANSVNWTDAGLSQGTTYYYRVIARNTNGNSPASDAVITVTESTVTIPAGTRIADHKVINYIRKGLISAASIQTAKDNLHIVYGHTSHGSQLTSGMTELAGFANGQGCNGVYSSNQNLFGFDYNGSGNNLHLNEGSLAADCGYYSTALSFNDYCIAKDIGNNPDSNWEYETRYFFGTPDASGHGSKNPSYNVVIWSWCGQAAWLSEGDITNYYLNPMSSLEASYPGIIFVYMTCHLDGTGTTGNLIQRDEQIRTYCRDNNKWLFDFVDIESYDPDGICYKDLYPNDGCIYDFNGNGFPERFIYDNGDVSETLPGNGDRNWALDWQNANTENVDWYSCGSAHSMALNANMKAYAAWWLWCRLAGWDI